MNSRVPIFRYAALPLNRCLSNFLPDLCGRQIHDNSTIWPWVGVGSARGMVSPDPHSSETKTAKKSAQTINETETARKSTESLPKPKVVEKATESSSKEKKYRVSFKLQIPSSWTPVLSFISSVYLCMYHIFLVDYI
jgi:hypothetical protein